MKNDCNNPITGINPVYTNYGYITFCFKGNIFFRVAKLTYQLFEDQSFQFIFEPYYDVIDGLTEFEIPGIDLESRQAVFYRVNIIPVFVSERIPPKNRVNIREELKEYGLDCYNPFLLLINSHKNYGGDNLTVKDESFFHQQFTKELDKKNIYKFIPKYLKNLASRIDFSFENLDMNSTNRATVIRQYLILYSIVTDYYDKKSKGNAGRKKHVVSPIIFGEIVKLYRSGVISLPEAIKRSGLNSERTFYRRLNDLDKTTIKDTV